MSKSLRLFFLSFVPLLLACVVAFTIVRDTDLLSLNEDQIAAIVGAFVLGNAVSWVIYAIACVVRSLECYERGISQAIATAAAIFVPGAFFVIPYLRRRSP